MAITVGTSSSNNADTPGNTITIASFTVAAGTDCLMVFVGAGSGTLGTRTTSGVTWNGNTLLHLGSSASDNGTFLRTDIFYLLSPTTGTGDVVVTQGGSNLFIFAAVQNLSGVHQSTPFGTPVLGSSTSTNTPSVNVSYSSGNYVFGIVASDANATITQTGTLVAEAEGIGADMCVGAQYFTGGGGTQAVSWSASTPDNGWSVTGVEVIASAGAGSTSSPMFRGV